MRADLRVASVVVCGLFVAEDPATVAARTHLGGSVAPMVAVDAVLAALMISYNYACSRYVVGVGASADIGRAMDELDAMRLRRISSSGPFLRTVRSALHWCNPFALLQHVGARLGTTLDRVGDRARQRRLRRTARFVSDLGAVNVLGVPGAGMAVAAAGGSITRRDSLRHCVLFVGSWFAGAHLIGWAVGRAHRFPQLGRVLELVTGGIGRAFTFLTDVTAPAGAIVVGLTTVAILRYASQVERIARSFAAAPLPTTETATSP